MGFINKYFLRLIEAEFCKNFLLLTLLASEDILLPMSSPEHQFGNQLSLGLLKVHSELEVSPEAMQGQPFRYFTFIKTPEGYGFDNLALPKGWQKAIPTLQEWFGNSEEQELVALDSQTKTLLIVGDRNSNAKIRLTSSGVYKASGITDIKTAIRLQSRAVHYLMPIAYGMDKSLFPWGYPRIEEYEHSILGPLFGSTGLQPPNLSWENKEPLISNVEAKKFIRDAKAMAKEFGDKIDAISFWPNGILANVTLNHMSCSCYGLEPRNELQGYKPHNVENAQEAVILHNAVSMYLNLLLEKGIEPQPLGL